MFEHSYRPRPLAQAIRTVCIALGAHLFSVSLATRASAETFYVSNAPTAGCTPTASPFCTIAQAVAAAAITPAADDVIVVHPGTYREHIDILNRTIPLTLRAEEGVIVDATDDRTEGPWVQYDSVNFPAIYYFTLPSPPPNANYIGLFVDQQRLSRNLTSIASLTENQFHYVAAPTPRVYLHLGGATPGSTGSIYVAIRLYCIFLSASSNITINNFAVSRAALAGVRLQNSTNCVVLNCAATEAGEHGIFAEGGSAHFIRLNRADYNLLEGIRLTSSAGDSVSFNTAAGNARDGIRLQNTGAAVVQQNSCTDNSANGIYVFGTTAPGVLLKQNSATANGDGIRIQAALAATVSVTQCAAAGHRPATAIGRGIFVLQSSGVTVSGNTSSNNERGIRVASSTGTLVSGNAVSANDIGIEAESDVSTTITNNDVASSALPQDGHGIASLESQSLVVSANRCSLNTANGIQLVSPTTASINANQLATNDENGIRVATGTGVTITNNMARGNRQDGISTENTAAVVVNYNTVFANGYPLGGIGARGQGIHVKGGTNHQLRGNLCYSNWNHGIFLSDASQSTIENNESHSNQDIDIIRNGVNGIRVGSSTPTPGVPQDGNIVQRNLVHDNEDTGIEFNHATSSTCRRNISWRNHDHGFDSIASNDTHFLNNIATRNSGSGISVENNSARAVVANCILVDNGIDEDRRAGGSVAIGYRGYNLEIGASAPSLEFQSHHNVNWSPDGAGAEPLIAWGAAPDETPYASVELFRADRAAELRDLECKYKESNPFFADTAGDFRPQVNSPSVDCADELVAGWAAPDIVQIWPSDEPAVANEGVPPGGTPCLSVSGFADRGAFEFWQAAGGCPVVDAWEADGWREENTVLGRSADGTLERDVYRLKSVPTPQAGRYRIRIREEEQSQAHS